MVVSRGGAGRAHVRIDRTAFRSLVGEISKDMMENAVRTSRRRIRLMITKDGRVNTRALWKSVDTEVSQRGARGWVYIGGPRTTRDGFDYSKSQEFGVDVIRVAGLGAMKFSHGSSTGGAHGGRAGKGGIIARQTGGGGTYTVRLAGGERVTRSRAAKAVPALNALRRAKARIVASDFTAGATRRS